MTTGRIAGAVVCLVLAVALFLLLVGGPDSALHKLAAHLGVENSMWLVLRSDGIDPARVSVKYRRIDERSGPLEVMASGEGRSFPGTDGAYEFAVHYGDEEICSAGDFTPSPLGWNRYYLCCERGQRGIVCSMSIGGKPLPSTCRGQDVGTVCRE